MTSRIYRYEVPLGMRVTHELTGDPLHVEILGYEAGVEFWAERDDKALPQPRTFEAYGTGHELPGGAVYRGTAPRTQHGFVWHLYEMPPEPAMIAGEPLTAYEAPAS